MDNVLCELLAESISRRCFHGHLPPDAEAVVSGIMRTLRPIFQDATDAEMQAFADKLLLAISKQIAIEASQMDDEIFGGWVQ